MISDESRMDILDAFSWYESRRTGLGKDFELCLEAGFHRIQQDPQIFQKRYKSLHIYFIDRFPFGIHYLVEENLIKVFGVFHTSRDPRNWTTRLRSEK
jgi:plasmid stabilization system protein ParE